MAAPRGWDYRDRATVAFQPVSDMLNVGRCEPLKAAVHGLLLATAAVCAAYNSAAWLKRRQRHLAINAVIYGAAIWWEASHVRHHLVECDGFQRGRRPAPCVPLERREAQDTDAARTAA